MQKFSREKWRWDRISFVKNSEIINFPWKKEILRDAKTLCDRDAGKWLKILFFLFMIFSIGFNRLFYINSSMFLTACYVSNWENYKNCFDLKSIRKLSSVEITFEGTKYEETAECCDIESDGDSRCHSCKIAGHAPLRPLLSRDMHDDKKETTTYSRQVRHWTNWLMRCDWYAVFVINLVFLPFYNILSSAREA